MNLSGFLLASPIAAEITREMLVKRDADSERGWVEFQGTLFKSRHWEEFRFISEKPIDEDDVRHHPEGPPYPHVMVSVRSRAKMLLLTERKKISEYIIKRILNRRIYPNLRRVRIQTGKLIASCQIPESPYLITTLHGSYAGTDHHINRISLYGDDLTESSLYREQSRLFNFYSCGVTRRMRENLLSIDLNEESEIVLVGNDGFFSGQISDPERAREVIQLINYIIRNRWVESWVPNVGLG